MTLMRPSCASWVRNTAKNARIHQAAYLTVKPLLSLRCQTQQSSSALSSAGYFKSHCCNQCGLRSDYSSRSSLIWVHTVCLYPKSIFEKFARRCSRRHKQTTFSDAGFLGILRVNRFSPFCTRQTIFTASCLFF